MHGTTNLKLNKILKFRIIFECNVLVITIILTVVITIFALMFVFIQLSHKSLLRVSGNKASNSGF
jgi:uncharacterized membrane protein